ncbi:hypothetical protein KKP97_04155, partial [Methanothermococcus sp. SCGC AD-155-C09]|nr:hypothetical protein [Methanothermococcus sp. SCGC AD-155-C09]
QVKPGKNRARGYGARIRDKIFDKNEYKKRGICEGFFGAITNWFGDRIPCFLMEPYICTENFNKDLYMRWYVRHTLF